ncbi:MAG: hypothetical protein HQM15_03325 [Deltaproteobacteria bacterium]|nr:hypothetical protein [Deltaproteobacteria bacterium]
MSDKAKQFFTTLKGIFNKNPFEKELKEALLSCQANPNDQRAKIRLGEIYFKRRELALGLQLFTEVAEAYVREGFFLKAVAIYKNMIRMSPGSVEYNEKLAEIYPQLGMVKDAINQYLIVINYYQSRAEKEKVLEVAQKMVLLDTQNPMHRMRLAEIYLNQGMVDAALKEYEQISEQLKQEGAKELKLLIEVLEKIYFRRPKDLNVLKELCILYLRKHDPESVMKKIERSKLEKEGDFEKIYLKAKEIFEYDQKKVVG